MLADFRHVQNQMSLPCLRNHRLRRRCKYPLTAPHCVKRIYTNLAVVDVTPEGLLVRKIVDGLSLAQLQALTEPPLSLANDWRPLAAPEA